MEGSLDTVRIDKGIPIPRKLGVERHISPHVRAIKALNVGDSIIYPGKPNEPIRRTAQRASSRVVHFKPKKFLTRTVIEKGKHAVRVWRIA